MKFRSEQDIGELLGASLSAVSSANSKMQSHQVGFLLRNCFEARDGKYVPLSVDLQLESGSLRYGDVPSVASTCVPFRVPLLTLLPLNSLAVDSAQLDFGLSVTSCCTSAAEADGMLMGTLRPKLTLRGKFSGTQDISVADKRGSRSDSGIHMSVSVKSVPLPKGTRTLLDLYTRSISPVSEPEKPKP